MVLFTNININQRVEILRGGRVFTGRVKYKGYVNGEPGEWVGVALDTADGLHDGMLNGRRYFSCRNQHGIFTTASQIRFIPLKRCLYNSYHSVGQLSTDDDLFTTEDRSCILERERERNEVKVDAKYRRMAMSARFPEKDRFERQHYPLNHSVGNYIPSAIMLKPELERSKCFGTGRSIPSRLDEVDDANFISSPTIPKIHMPHSLQKRQTLRGWQNTHLTREVTLNTAKDSIKYQHWNDL